MPLGNVLECEVSWKARLRASCRAVRHHQGHSQPYPRPQPFIYKVHQKGTAQYQQVVNPALGHRLAHQSYSAMRRVLDTSDLSLDRNTYYNLVRGKPLEQSNDLFEGLVPALEEVGFRFNCLMGAELAEDGSIKGRILEQVFFITDIQIVYARRFIANQVLLIDGTFETNRLSMVLLVVVGITSTNDNFRTGFHRQHWQPKENRFVTAFTKFSPNLGYNSSQRAESIHPVTTTSKPSVLRQRKIPRMRKGRRLSGHKVNHRGCVRRQVPSPQPR